MIQSRFFPGLLLISALAAIRLPIPLSGASNPPVERQVTLHASRFAFTPATLKVEKGARITVVLISEDVVHGLSLDGYGLKLQAEPGQPARASFLADRSGTFRLRCSVTCGPLHPFMLGRIEVGETAQPVRAVAASLLALSAGVISAVRGMRRET